MKTIYVAISGRDPKNPDATVADGPMEIDDDADVLTAIKKKYPLAAEAEEHEKGSSVFIVREKKNG